MPLQRKENDRCRIRDQFCTGKNVGKCKNCHEPTCAACSVIMRDGVRLCHMCLRGTGNGAYAEHHLEEIGGVSQKIDVGAWRPVKR
jgi:hypothetical protein